MGRLWCVPIVIAATLGFFTRGNATADSESCPRGNLLAAPTVARAKGVEHVLRLTDGIVVGAGEGWLSDRTSRFAASDAAAVWDLGRVRRMRGALIQADNDDRYTMEASLDGASWTPLWIVRPADGNGMRIRETAALDAHARYVRLTVKGGDGRYAVAEVQLFCDVPAIWPPTLETARGVVRDEYDERQERLAWGKAGVGTLAALFFLLLVAPMGGARRRAVRPWALAALSSGAVAVAAASSTNVVLTVSLIAIAAIPWGAAVWAHARSRGSAHDNVRFERVPLLVVAVVGVVTWTNFGTLHGPRAIHYWDMFHYYVGAKYFPETRYHLLYHCLVQAEFELKGSDARARAAIAKRRVRNLTTNKTGPAVAILDDPAPCREAFTPERWQSWKDDIAFFRARLSRKTFSDLGYDHGYNASPIFTMLASPLANLGAASESLLGGLACIDVILYAAMFALIGWSFGLRAAALALIVWSVGFPWMFEWTGGSLLRALWLAAAGAGVCFLKQRRPVAAGFAFALAALDRLFPALLLGGIAFRIGIDLFRTKRIAPHHVRFLVGFALGFAILVPVSLALTGGPSTAAAFIDNTMKHIGTPFSNNMGLATIVAFDPERTDKRIDELREKRPVRTWKEQKRDTLDKRRTYLWACAAVLLVVVAFAAWHLRDDWEIALVGVLSVMATVELTSYYMSFVVLLAPLAVRRARDAAALLAMAVATQVGQLVWEGIDVRHFVASIIVLATALYLVTARLWLASDRPND